MTISLCYWILMLIWLFWANWPTDGVPFTPNRPALLLFVLLVLLGWKTFGPPIHS